MHNGGRRSEGAHPLLVGEEKILRPDSSLGAASSGGADELGAVAAIRMLRVSNFKGGTPELIQKCYAILVLVLPSDNARVWSYQELEIVKVVADQVAIALSHAAVLEESQLMREKMLGSAPPASSLSSAGRG